MGDKWARAHCPGISDEQRCENVTTNSPWSPNVTFPLYSTALPSSYSVLVSLLSNHPLLFFSLFALLSIYSPLFTIHCFFLFFDPLTIQLFFSSPQKGREGKRGQKSVFLTQLLSSCFPSKPSPIFPPHTPLHFFIYFIHIHLSICSAEHTDPESKKKQPN